MFIYSSICLDFSGICSRHSGVVFLFFYLYFHIWVLDFVSIVAYLETWRSVDTEQILYEGLRKT